MFSSNKDRMH